MIRNKRNIKKYFRQLVPISPLIREEYVRYKLKHKSKSDATNYEKQLEYNWDFCMRCWRRFSWKDSSLKFSLDNHEFCLCESCHDDKAEWVRNKNIDIEDIIENWIDVIKLFSLKVDFYKKYR